MILRFLLLLIIFLTTSCNEKLQDKDHLCNNINHKSLLNNDQTEQSNNLKFSLLGIASNNEAHLQRTNIRLRIVQRTFDNRKLFSNNVLTVYFKHNLLKNLAQKRLFLCHLRYYSGSLLHILCKLTVFQPHSRSFFVTPM